MGVWGALSDREERCPGKSAQSCGLNRINEAALKHLETPEAGRAAGRAAVAGVQPSGARACGRARPAVRWLGARGGGGGGG